LRVTLELQTAERITQALEQLGRDRLELRLGAIYALERFARQEADHAQIMEILTAYVREHAKVRSLNAPGSRLPADIQAAMTVIGRRNRIYQNGETYRLDLRQTDLRLANLSGAHLEGAILSEAYLQGANLSEGHLEKAVLRAAVLDGATLAAAHLQSAYLAGAHLNGTKLRDANLEEAFLNGAELEGADLRGANLTGAIGLSWEQVKTALRDNRTRFPDYLATGPSTWPASP
jgi:uncharacterized protein YjbI with pentapeptide repeats